MPAKFKPAEGDVRFNGVVVEVEEKNGKAVSIKRIALA
jgi:calcineurin-like phosphoesterase